MAVARMALVLASLVVCAAFTARGVVDMVSQRLIVVPPSSNGWSSPNRMDEPHEAGATLSRIFNAMESDLSSHPAEDGPELCPSRYRLVGSLVDARHPDRSYAAIADGATPRILTTGSQLDEHEVMEIARARVVLRTPDGTCDLRMFEQTLAAEPRTEPEGATDDDGIEALGEDRYRIPEVLRTRVLASPTEVLGTARMIPARPEGLRVLGIRRSSVLHRLGLRSGDVLRRVNGQPLHGVDDGLAAFASFRDEPRLSLTVLRRGEMRTLEYEFQP
ncbi:MAG: type II secretion system protein GspC [Myxococcota bacterium]